MVINTMRSLGAQIQIRGGEGLVGYLMFVLKNIFTKIIEVFNEIFNTLSWII